MEVSIRINDESKLDFLLQLLREFQFVEVLPLSKEKTKHASPAARRKKRTPEQEEFIEDIRQGLLEVEQYRQGKIQLQTLQEFLAEEA